MPLKVVKAVLPVTVVAGFRLHWRDLIGDLVIGIKIEEREVFIYNVADHEEAVRGGRQLGIWSTAGVPAAAAAILVPRRADGTWAGWRRYEELPPRPFLCLLGRLGL